MRLCRLAVLFLMSVVTVPAALAAAVDSPSLSSADNAKPLEPFEGNGAQVSMWLTTGFGSTHASSKHAPVEGYAHHNHGVGAEVYFSKNWGVALGEFTNSYDTKSRYLQGIWFPTSTQAKVGPVDFKFGLLGGIVDGYMNHRDGDWNVAVLPALAIEWKRIGANIIYAPETSRSDAMLAIQFKLKAF